MTAARDPYLERQESNTGVAESRATERRGQRVSLAHVGWACHLCPAPSDPRGVASGESASPHPQGNEGSLTMSKALSISARWLARSRMLPARVPVSSSSDAMATTQRSSVCPKRRRPS